MVSERSYFPIAQRKDAYARLKDSLERKVKDVAGGDLVDVRNKRFRFLALTFFST